MKFSWRSGNWGSRSLSTDFVRVKSREMPGVTFVIERVSLGRRIELARRVRDAIARMEFLAAGSATEKLDSAIAGAEIDRICILWGLKAIEGLDITPETLVERGPEALSREALRAIRRELGLSEEERKN